MCFVLDLLEALGNLLREAPNEDKAVIRRCNQMLHIRGEAHRCRNLTWLSPAQWMSRRSFINRHTFTRGARHDDGGIVIYHDSKLDLIGAAGISGSALLFFHGGNALFPDFFERWQLP